MKHPDLKLFASIFKKYPKIQAVYLFGSSATGKVHKRSDLDLAIYTETKDLHKQKLSILYDLACYGFCDIDLVFLDGDDIVLKYEAVRQNILVYQTAGFDRGAVYSKIIRQYFDFYPYLAVQRQAYKERILYGKSGNNT